MNRKRNPIRNCSNKYIERWGINDFKVVYRRHTNFAIESIEQTFNGVGDFGRKVTTTVARNGDLIWKAYVQVKLPRVETNGCSFRWVDDLGHHLIKCVDIEIGGQRIDRQFGDWLQIWNDLTIAAGQRRGYQKMICGSFRGEHHYPGSLQQWSPATKPSRTCWIPLQFWFNRNIGLALPLIALQYHEVKICVEFRPSSELVITANPALTNLSLDAATMYIDYIYLDTDERRRFAQVSHEYLIEQLQFTGEESICNTANKIRLNFNHPVKELIWVVQHDDLIGKSEVNDLEGVLANNQWSNYTDVLGSLTYDHSFPLLSGNPVEMAKLQLNGHDRFSTRLGDYFNLVQPYQHHTNIPLSPGINVYSFAIRPEEHNPSGSANFSRIDNATLQLSVKYANTLLEDCTVDTTGLPVSFVEDIEPFLGCSLEGTNLEAKVRVYATNYNVLRIMSGINSDDSQVSNEVLNEV